MLDKFGQSWNLRFVNFNIEQNYKEDCSKIQNKTSYLILFALSFFLIYLVSQKELIWYHICFILFPIIPTPLLKSLTLELSSIILLIEDSSTPSIPSLTMYMFPSFLGHYLFWKRWEYFSILLLPKAFLVPTLLASFEFYLVSCFYLFLSLKLEKDLRSTWKNMKKHKESNHIYREIWMKTPFPVFILSQKQGIVCANYFFINFFGKDCKFEDLFKNDNFNVVLSVLKKVFQKGNKEEIMIKERNDSWLLIIRCVEWKYERCAEISIVEILEAAYSERIFAKHYQVQDHALIELNDLIIEIYQENLPASLEFFNEVYKFCINLWSYQIFLEQQASYSISNDAKCIDFCIEIENTIEIFNIKQNDCNVNYRFRFCSGNHSVLVNECRLKLLLFVLFDYIRLRADKGCVVDVNLQSFDRNNNKVKYLLKVDFKSSAVTDLELNEVFRKKKKDLQEFEEFVNRFGIAYGLLGC